MSNAPVNKTVNIYIDQSAAQYNAQKLEKTILRLETSIKKGTAAGKDMTKEIEALGKAKGKLEELGKIMDGKMATPLRDMRKYVQNLRRELEGMSKDSSGFDKKNKEYTEASKRLKELESQIKSVRTTMDATDKGGFMDTLKGVFGGVTLANGLQAAVSWLKQGANYASQMAYEAEGVKTAFDRLGRPGLLAELRKATRGTVSDLELMKKAVAFQNFGLPIEKMASALEFARIRAKATGQDVNYLVESIVLGIGRKSLPILDNLGISSTRINTELSKTPDFATSAFNIIQQETQKAGKDLLTYKELQDQVNAMYDNMAVSAGGWVNATKGFVASAIKDLQGFGDISNRAFFAAFLLRGNDIKAAEEATNKRTTDYFNQFWDKYAEAYKKGDFKARQEILKTIEASGKATSDKISKQFASDREKVDRHTASIADAIQRFKDAVAAQKVNVSALSAGSIKGATMEQLTQMEDAIGNERLGLNSGDKLKLANLDILQNLINKERDALSGAASKKAFDEADRKAKAAQEKLKAAREELKQLAEQVEAMTRDAATNGTVNDEQEITRVKQKYAKLLREFRKYSAEAAQLDELQRKELGMLYAKQFTERSEKEYATSLQSLTDYFAKERTAVKQNYADGITTKQQYTAQLLALDEAEANARAVVAEDYKVTAKKAAEDAEKAKTEATEKGIVKREAITDRTNRNILAGYQLQILTARKGSKQRLDAEIAYEQELFNQQTASLDKNSNEYLALLAQYQEREKQLRQSHQQDTLQIISDFTSSSLNLLNSYFDLLATRGDAEVERERRRNTAKKESFQKLLDEKKITQAEYDRQAAAADKELKRKEYEEGRKQFNRNKTLQIVNATIDAAKSITSIWASYGANPILAGILTGVSAAATGIQIASISQQKYPEFAKGRRPMGEGGVPEGSSHANNGIKLVDGSTGQTVGEMEGNEPILSVNTYRNNRPLVDALLETSMKRNGAPIKWFGTAPARMNVAAINRGYQSVSTFKNGGMAGGGTMGSTMDASQLTDLLQKMTEFFNSPMKAYVVYQDLAEKQKTMQKLEAASRASG